MTHIGSPKRFIFNPDPVEISEISIRNIIEKGDANHAFKAYKLSHFLPNSYPSSLVTHVDDTQRIWHQNIWPSEFQIYQVVAQ